MRRKEYKVSVIVPVFNEEGCVKPLTERVLHVIKNYSDYEILFIDDGSGDSTLNMLKELHSDDKKINYLSFSRNFGHQNALRAGTKYANGDCIVSLDGDLQHPPEIIPELIKKWEEGYDIVYTIRKDINRLPFVKRITSRLFYRIMNSISDIDFKFGEADFRLLDRKVADEVNNLGEDAVFLRGMIKWLGFKQTGVEYTPDKRIWGSTQYSGKKMFSLAMSGITGFSTKPLRISTMIGIIIALLSLVYGVYALYVKLFTDNAIEGWTSVFFMVSLIGGIQLIMIGILGEYLGKTFMETKKRPHFIISENSLAK